MYVYVYVEEESDRGLRQVKAGALFPYVAPGVTDPCLYPSIPPTPPHTSASRPALHMHSNPKTQNSHLQLRVRDVRLLEAEPGRADEALEPVCHCRIRIESVMGDGISRSAGARACAIWKRIHDVCVEGLWQAGRAYLGAFRVKLSPTNVTLVTMRFHDLAAGGGITCGRVYVCIVRARKEGRKVNR